MTDEPKLQWVSGEFSICEWCLEGQGGECHTPGCLFWINRAPDLPLRGTLVEIHGCTVSDEPSSGSENDRLRELEQRCSVLQRALTHYANRQAHGKLARDTLETLGLRVRAMKDTP